MNFFFRLNSLSSNNTKQRNQKNAFPVFVRSYELTEEWPAVTHRIQNTSKINTEVKLAIFCQTRWANIYIYICLVGKIFTETRNEIVPRDCTLIQLFIIIFNSINFKFHSMRELLITKKCMFFVFHFL